MRTIRNLVGLLFLGALLLADGAGLKANEPSMMCGEEPDYWQSGVVCEYAYPCWFDGTPGTEHSPMEEFEEWTEEFCGDNPGTSGVGVGAALEDFCIDFTTPKGDPLGYYEGLSYTNYSPYYVMITENYEGFCNDGEFTCRMFLEGMCPS
jgi:hypothetical protein